MRLFLVALAVMGVGLAADRPQPATPMADKNPMQIQLTDAEKVSVMELQREQYRQLAEREKARAAFLQAQTDLDSANSNMATLQEKVRTAHKCPECSLLESLILQRPMPKEITVLPNK